MTKLMVYGIPNCDVVKKTMNWLTAKKTGFEFHDYKRSGISKEKLEAWCKEIGWEALLNKRSTTWRELPLSVQNKITNQPAAIKLMMEQTSIIKRPVIEYGRSITAGFNETEINKHLKSSTT